jgi:tetratricopeptide (TPR) repeat protein
VQARVNVDAVDPKHFVSLVQPALQAQDWDRLMKTLKSHWTSDQILSLLSCGDCDARKIAALAIGLVGQSCCLPDLQRKLLDHDHMVVKMAEHAMWQIWFRGGACDQANKHLARGAECLNRQELDKAIEHLNRAISLSPDFAEAYNQRAIAHYLAERYEDSVADSKKVVKLMPLHFGAWSGLGHAYLAMGKLDEAQAAYERALELNPHLDCIAELVQELREQGDAAA